MWLLGDNYDKMKAVKFLPLFSALQMVPPLSKMEMRFHVAVIARVPVSLFPSRALTSLFLLLPVSLSLSLSAAVSLLRLPLCQFFSFIEL